MISPVLNPDWYVLLGSNVFICDYLGQKFEDEVVKSDYDELNGDDDYRENDEFVDPFMMPQFLAARGVCVAADGSRLEPWTRSWKSKVSG